MGRRFLHERQRDPFYRAAQNEGLRSRAAFKLAYLADRFPVFRERDSVLDLGAAPGGWSMVARQCLGKHGRVVAVDPRRIEPIDGVEYVRGKVGDPAIIGRLGPARFQVVLSDMSPTISGAYATDHARSVALVHDALELCKQVLSKGGTFVAKVFAGDLLSDLQSEMTTSFERVVRTKPPASREHSSELYLLGFGYRGVSDIADR